MKTALFLVLMFFQSAFAQKVPEDSSKNQAPSGKKWTVREAKQKCKAEGHKGEDLIKCMKESKEKVEAR